MTAIRAVLAAVWAVVAVVVLSASPADSPLRVRRDVQRGMIAVFPQGWAFFTRDPREPVDEAYRPGERLVPILYPNSSARNLFGFSRRARAQNVEMAALLLEVPASAWKECRAPLRRCLEVAPGCAVAVANVSVTRQICGPVVVERQPPVPWAWGRSTGRIHMPSKVVRLEVACPASG